MKRKIAFLVVGLVMMCLGNIAHGQCKEGKCDFAFDGNNGSFKYTLYAEQGEKIISYFTSPSEPKQLDFSRSSKPGFLVVKIETIDWGSKIGELVINETYIKADKAGKGKISKEGENTYVKFPVTGSTKGVQIEPDKLIVEFGIKYNEKNYKENSFKITQKYKVKAPKPSSETTIEDDAKKETNAWQYREKQAKIERADGSDKERKEYLEYLKEYPKGANKENAKVLLNKFYEKELKTALEKRTPAPLQEFITKYGSPDCEPVCDEIFKQHREQAEAALKKLQAVPEKLPTGETTVTSGRKPGGNNPGGTIPPPPPNPCDETKRANEWTKAQSADTPKAYLDFSKKCGDGYSSEAKNRYDAIFKMDDDAWKAVQKLITDAKNDLKKCEAYKQYLNGNIEIKPFPNHLKEVQDPSGKIKQRKRYYERHRAEANAAMIQLGCKLDKLRFGEITDAGEGAILVPFYHAEKPDAKDLTATIAPEGFDYPKDNYQIGDVEKVKDGEYKFKITGLEGGNYEITVKDKSGNSISESHYVTEVNPRIEVKKEADGKYSLHIFGGSPPFALRVVRGGTTLDKVVLGDIYKLAGLRHFDDITNKIEQFNASALYEIMAINAVGNYPIADSIKTQIGETDWTSKLLLWGSILLAFVALYLVVRVFLKDQLRKSSLARILFGLEPPAPMIASKLPEKVDASAATPIAGSPISIKPKAPPVKVKVGAINKDVGSLDRAAVMDSKTYFGFNMADIWQNSAVRGVFLHSKCAAELDTAIREEANRRDIAGDDHPEIGGFLLGKYLLEDGQYFVSLEKYVPATVEKHDVYEVDLTGVQATIELDNARQTNPDLVTVGWFHTHPGHSLFLSKPDLSVHKGHFNKPYQMAMEMDTLTTKMDFTFFSWQKGGENMNNRSGNQSDQRQFEWTLVDEWRRKSKRS